MKVILSIAALLACGAAHASDGGWVRVPGVGWPDAKSYYEWNPSGAQKAKRDDYPNHRVIAVWIRIHDPGQSSRPQHLYIDCIAQEQMTVFDPQILTGYAPIPLQGMLYVVWDELCNKPQ